MNRFINSANEFGKVAVLMGGTSAEREVSLKSGAAVLAGLKAQGIDAYAVDPKSELSRLSSESFDRVFNILHGRKGEDGVMQGYLELLNLPYTGSGVFASALSMNKLRTKQIWQSCNIITPPFLMINGDYQADQIASEIGFPLMVKPINEGSSIGISRVERISDLDQAIEEALRFDKSVMVEKWMDGNEYTVAIIKDEALPSIRLETPNSFYDYEAKYQSDTTRYHCPSGLDKDRELEIQKLALNAFDAVGASGWGRVDVMADSEGNFYPIEINTLPGMTDHSLVPMAAKAAGMSFEALVWQILETSFSSSHEVSHG